MLLRIYAVAAAVALLVVSTSAGVHNVASAAAGGNAQRTGHIIVRFRRDAQLSAIANGLSAAQVEARASTAGSRLVLVDPAVGQTVDGAVAQLRQRKDVEFAEPDTVVSIATTTPTDPLYAPYQWDAVKIGLPSAWDRTTGSSTVTVAVVDTGVDATHPELSGHLVAGYNFIANNANTADDNSHGTFVAGIIAASANNSTGIAGVCWSCKIMPVKSLDAQGIGSAFTAAQGIDWAVAHGASVINMSFAGGDDAGLLTAVDNAWAAGVVLVAATGNDNGPVLYPAGYAHVVGVGSSSQTDARSSFSNYGPEIDLVAPGESIVSALCTCAGFPGGYASGAGTSFAAPHVAGVAALMIAAGTTSNSAIVARLTSAASDVNTPGFDNETGWGRLNAAAAVAPQYGIAWGANALPPSMLASATASVHVTFTNSGTLTWSNVAPNPVRFAYHWKSGACPGGGTVVRDGVRTALPSPVAPGAAVSSLAALVVAPATAGTYCLVYDLVREGITWFSSQGAATQSGTVTVSTPVYGVSWGVDTTPSSMLAGSRNGTTISFTNTGSLTWPASGLNPVRLSYHWRNGSCAGSSIAVWNGVRTALPADTASGGAVSNLTSSVIAPASPGTYCLIYDLVREGVTWFSSQGGATRSKTVTVTTPVYGVSWGAQTTPSTMSSGSNYSVTVTFTNAGSLTWASAGTNAVRLSYHWRDGACPGATSAVWDGVRAALPSDTGTGVTVSALPATVAAPPVPGTYCLLYDLVREGVTWFSTQGAATLRTTVVVT